MENHSPGESRARSFEGVVNRIQEWVDRGTFAPGDRLPPERELAESLGVSRATLKEAFRVLEHIGLVESKHGKGRFVAQIPTAAEPAGSPSRVLEYSTIMDLLQVRRFLEVPMTGLATELATPEELARIERALEVPDASLEAWLHSDIEFHIAIAAATHNVVYLRFISSQEVLLYRMALTSALLPVSGPLRDQHRQVMEAMRHRDRLEAEAAMIHHLTSAMQWARSMLSQSGAPLPTASLEGQPSR